MILDANPCTGDEGGPVMFSSSDDPYTDIFDGIIFDADCTDDNIAPYLSISYYWPWIYEMSMTIDAEEEGIEPDLSALIAYEAVMASRNAAQIEILEIEDAIPSDTIESTIPPIIEYDDDDDDFGGNGTEDEINSKIYVETGDGDKTSSYDYMVEISESGAFSSFNVFYNFYCLVLLFVVEVIVMWCV